MVVCLCIGAVQIFFDILSDGEDDVMILYRLLACVGKMVR